MIQSVIWPDPSMGEFRSPFARGEKERPLRLSLHIQSLKNLPEEQSAAYQAIRELGGVDLVEVFSTDEDAFPHWRFMPSVERDGYLHIEVLRDGTHLSLHAGVLLEVELRGENPSDLGRNDALLARAHSALHRDIFVTASPLLMGSREKFTRSNIHSPVEAARLVGLFLRSRGDWTYRKVGVAKCLTSRHSFYWVLSRMRLPALWRYFSACVCAKEFLGDQILYLGQSILERSSRALQARDAVGVQFYLPQDHGVGDEIMYHFDYLLLLLVGILDALAKIAAVVYGITIKDHNVGFRNETFLKALRKSGAENLFKVIKSEKCQCLMVMLHTLRNTIHNAGLTATLAQTPWKERLLIGVPTGLQKKLWEATVTLGTPDEWGISQEERQLYDPSSGQTSRETKMQIEPYSYASRLVSEWFGLINQVADSTEVEKLFEGQKLPDLSRRFPDDWSNYLCFSALG